jgi:hypothetical protein
MTDTTWTIDGVTADALVGTTPNIQPGEEISPTFVFLPSNQSTPFGARANSVRDIGASAPQDATVSVSPVTDKPSFVESVRPGAPRSEVVVEFTTSVPDTPDFWAYVTGYEEETEIPGIRREITLNATVIDIVEAGTETKSELKSQYSKKL